MSCNFFSAEKFNLESKKSEFAPKLDFELSLDNVMDKEGFEDREQKFNALFKVTFNLYNGIAGDSGTACSSPNVYPYTWYFIGPGIYPTVGDTIYVTPGNIYNLNNNWMKISNGHALQGNSSGVITQDLSCVYTYYQAHTAACSSCGTPGADVVVKSTTPLSNGSWYSDGTIAYQPFGSTSGPSFDVDLSAVTYTLASDCATACSNY